MLLFESVEVIFMPIYDFQCIKCGFKNEVMRKISAANVEACPECGAADSFTKQVSAPSFQLNGNGWYVTDFKNKPAPAAKTESKPTTSS